MNIYTPANFNGAKLLGTAESGSKEWHELRSNSIGGSEVGTILGLNKWESPFSLWARKTKRLPDKELNSFAVNLGNVLEPVILDDLLPMKHPDWKIYRTGTYQHPKFDYMHANLDALAEVNGEWIVVEVKTSRNYWDEVPPNYVAQVMHYMNIMGLRKGVIVGLVAMDWVEHWIDFDQFEADVIEQRITQFWNMVKEDKQPDFDGADSTYETVRELNPDIDGSAVEISGGEYLIEAQTKFDEAEKKLKKAKAEVMDAMGKAERAYVKADGNQYTIATRRARSGGKPFLVVNKKGK